MDLTLQHTRSQLSRLVLLPKYFLTLGLLACLYCVVPLHVVSCCVVQVTLLSRCGAAPDHPLNPGYPEGEYLTALIYRVV